MTESSDESSMCVVVVNYKSAGLLRRHLAAVSLQAANVVVVDNYSSAEEQEEIRSLTRECRWALVELPDNRGFGAGVNAGVTHGRSLGHRCFLLLNPDVEITSDVVEQLRLTVSGDPMTLASPILRDGAGRVAFAGSTLDLNHGRVRGRSSFEGEHPPGCVPWLTAACLAIHDELWTRVGGFDESYFMYWEDVDFGYRCWGRGARLSLRTDLVVTHHQGGTQGNRRGRAKSGLYYYFNIRNRMLFAAGHLDAPGLKRWLIRIPATSWEVLMRGGRRQLLESPQVLVASFRGMVAAVWIGLRAQWSRRAANSNR